MASTLTIASTSAFATGASLRRSTAGARRPVRVVRQVTAKYNAEEGKYFDLSDLEDTVGSWDMYGSDSAKDRYNGLQSEFFTRATEPLSRRSSLLAFTTGIGAAAILVWGAKGAKLANLPITVGPQKPAEAGPRGRI